MMKGFSRKSPTIFHPRVSVLTKSVSKSLPSFPPITKPCVLPLKLIKCPLSEISADSDDEDLPKLVFQFCCQRDFSTAKKIVKTPDCNRGSASDAPNTFVKKCVACTGFCDFSSIDSHYTQKILKEHMLEDITEMLESAKMSKRLTQECFQYFIGMFSAHAFRPFQPFPQTNISDYVVRNMEWPHLELVYHALEVFLSSNSIRSSLILGFITPSFIRNLYECFKFPDKREQMAICSILLTIAAKFQSTHKIITKENSKFLIVAHYDYAVQIALSSFFEFFSVWVSLHRAKHSAKVLKMYILPLVMLDSFPNFQASFTDTICSFINQEKAMVDVCIDYILKHWPITNPPKQKIFMQSINTILESYSKNLSQKNISKLIFRMITSFNDSTALLSQVSLQLVLNQGFQALLSSSWPIFGPLVYNAAKNAQTEHWNQETRKFASNVLLNLERVDPKVVSLIIPEQPSESNNSSWSLIRLMADSS